jgi:two-component sensor histidine kinase
LTGELQHRTKNLLAVIQSVAGQSLSGTQSLEQARGIHGPIARAC